MLIYKNKKYATTTNFQFECDRVLDCQIIFKRPDSKFKFLELYSRRDNQESGDKAVIDGIKYNLCFFYNLTDSTDTIKCHINKEAGYYPIS